MAASAIAAGLDRQAARAPPRASASWTIAIIGCAAATTSFTLAVVGEGVGVRFLERRADVESGRIGGIGLSVGGEMMLEATARTHALDAVVSEGPASDPFARSWT
jgi:hypothetical protein